jgi:hypothetical protein
MTLRLAVWLVALAPTIAAAQTARNGPARNGNVWDGKAHQPTAADVTGRERQSGIAPPDPHARAQQEDLDRMGRQLTDRAAKVAPVPHTVQPGGVVPAPPSPPSR